MHISIFKEPEAKEQNPVGKTFAVCMLFSILLAGAAIIGIVSIAKSNKKRMND